MTVMGYVRRPILRRCVARAELALFTPNKMSSCNYRMYHVEGDPLIHSFRGDNEQD